MRFIYIFDREMLQPRPCALWELKRDGPSSCRAKLFNVRPPVSAKGAQFEAVQVSAIQPGVGQRPTM
jgi:hypothetical protein